MHTHYELRAGGQAIAQFDTPQPALDRARELLRADPDCEVEIIDTRTGRAFEPAASQRWRDELTAKIG